MVDSVADMMSRKNNVSFLMLISVVVAVIIIIIIIFKCYFSRENIAKTF